VAGLGRAAAWLALTFLMGLVVAGLAPALTGRPVTVVMSGSMSPAIAAGDVIVAEPVSASRLQPRDVIIFTDPAGDGHTLVHRVVSRRADGSIVTQGDANAVADSTPVPPSAVRGRMTFRVPYAGLPRYWLVSRQWLPLAATGMLLGLLVAAAVRDESPAPRPTGPVRRATHLRG
jgi:signal peptidase